jgi:hypothetical protein
MEEQIINIDDITRIEVINHAKNKLPTGRLVVLLKDMEDFDEIEVSVQDDGKTLKIFLK